MDACVQVKPPREDKPPPPPFEPWLDTIKGDFKPIKVCHRSSLGHQHPVCVCGAIVDWSLPQPFLPPPLLRWPGVTVECPSTNMQDRKGRPCMPPFFLAHNP